MARTGTQLTNDYNTPVKQCGSFNTGQKQAIVNTNRAVTGKTVNVQVSNTLSAAVAVPDLAFKVSKGKRYRIAGNILTNGTGAAGGIKLGFTYPGSTATPAIGLTYNSAAASATEVLTTVNSQGAGAAAAVLVVEVAGYIQADVSGVITLTAANTTGAQAALVNVGSWLAVTKI